MSPNRSAQVQTFLVLNKTHLSNPDHALFINETRRPKKSFNDRKAMRFLREKKRMKGRENLSVPEEYYAFFRMKDLFTKQTRNIITT